MRRKEDRDKHYLIIALTIINAAVSIYAIYAMSSFQAMVSEIREKNREITSRREDL